EAIPDPSMPAGGCGRAPILGNFVLTDFRVLAANRMVTWSRAHADFSQGIQGGRKKNFSIALPIVGDESTGWAIWPRAAEPHSAVFIQSQPITAAGKVRLTIALAVGSKDKRQYNLGRFRVSVTGDPVRLDEEQKRLAALKLTDPWSKLAAAYVLNGRNSKALESFGIALQRADGRAAKARIIAAAAPLPGLLYNLAESSPNDAEFQAELARHYAERGSIPLAD